MNILNISEFGTGRQANNVLPQALVATVTPWFADVADNCQVRKALASLQGGLDQSALDFLGLKVEAALDEALTA